MELKDFPITKYRMNVSIIIVNYNTRELITQCIESVIKKTKGLTYEIIVVDNASSDGSKECFECDNRITYIYSDENLGFGRANNLGATYAIGQNLFFLNPDTILISNAIKSLNDYLMHNPLCGACGGNLYDKDNNPIHSHNKNFPGFFEELDQAFKRKLSNLRYGKSTLFNHSDKPINVAYITGADLMVRKSIFDSLDGFNPAFFMYYEETELQYRIRKNGFQICNIPYAKIIHLEGMSFINSRKRETLFLRSRVTYYSLTHSRIYRYFISKFYYAITWMGYKVSCIMNNGIMKKKMKQRMSILKEIKNHNIGYSAPKDNKDI